VVARPRTKLTRQSIAARSQINELLKLYGAQLVNNYIEMFCRRQRMANHVANTFINGLFGESALVRYAPKRYAVDVVKRT
jgi:hypothetical protein